MKYAEVTSPLAMRAARLVSKPMAISVPPKNSMMPDK
jgi:hypothetical protein